MTALIQSRWVLGLSLLALCSAGPAFAQAPLLPFAFTFDENAHGSVTFSNGTVAPLGSSTTFVDPVLPGVPTLFYFLSAVIPTDGFVGLIGTEAGFPTSDVLHFSSTLGGVFFFSDPTEPGAAADLADVSLISYLNVLSQPITLFIPEVGSEGANGAFYTPGATDPGFSLVQGFSASYHIISDAGPGSTVPEPSSLVLLTMGLGLAGLARVTWRRHRRK